MRAARAAKERATLLALALLASASGGCASLPRAQLERAVFVEVPAPAATASSERFHLVVSTSGARSCLPETRLRGSREFGLFSPPASRQGSRGGASGYGGFSAGLASARVVYTYDAANRLKTAIPAVAAATATQLDAGDRLAYDRLSRPTALERGRPGVGGLDPALAVRYPGYDLGSRPASEVVGSRSPLAWGYDTWSRPVEVSLPAGAFQGFTRSFDTLDRLAEISVLGAGPSTSTIGATWAWGGADRLYAMTTKGALGTSARYGYHGGAGPQVPGFDVTQASKWKLGTLTWGNAGNAGPTAAPQTAWGVFGYGWRGHEGDPQDGAKIGRRVLSLPSSSVDLFAGLGWSWGYDGGVRLATAAAGAGDLEGRGPPPGSGAETFRYTYGPGDELERIVRESTGQIAELATGDYGRILSRNGLPFTYDGAGRRIEDDRARYAFDWRGDLVTATVKNTWPDEDGDGEGKVTPWVGHQIREVRDAAGRLTERWHYGRLPEGTADDSQRPFIEKRTYIWENDRLAAEVATDADGTVLRWRTTYLPGPTGLDDAPQVTVEIGDQPGPFANTIRTYTLVRDELGSVIAVVAEGEGGDAAHPPVVARVAYTPYGEAHVESGPEFQRGRFDGEKTAAKEGTAAGALVTQTIADEGTAAAGALVLDWSLPLDASSLAAGLSVERLVSGSGWVALAQEEFVVGPEPEDGGISSGGGGPPARLLVLTKTGWARGTSYRVRLTPELTDQFGRSFARTESLEWRVPEAPVTGPMPAVAFDKKIPTRFESWEAASDTLGGRFPGGLSILWQGLLHDRVTGLAYARARHLDSRTASFLEEDPLLDVDSVNRYSFVAWQPNMSTDPRGLCVTEDAGCFLTFLGEYWKGIGRDVGQAGVGIADFATVGSISDVRSRVSTFRSTEGSLTERARTASRAGLEARARTMTLGFYGAEDKVRHASELVGFEGIKRGGALIGEGIGSGDVETTLRGVGEALGGIGQFAGTVGAVGAPVQGALKSRAAQQSARAASVAARSDGLLQRGPGLNVSPEAWFKNYPQLGASGRSFVTDIKAVEDVLGPIAPSVTSMRVGWHATSRLEAALGLEPQSLQRGFRLTFVPDVATQAPSAPLVGNRFFRGAGRGLPAGGPELTITVIPTKGSGFREVRVIVQ